MDTPEAENVALLDDEAREAETIAPKRSSRGGRTAKGDLGSSCTPTHGASRFFFERLHSSVTGQFGFTKSVAAPS